MHVPFSSFSYRCQSSGHFQIMISCWYILYKWKMWKVGHKLYGQNAIMYVFCVVSLKEWPQLNFQQLKAFKSKLQFFPLLSVQLPLSFSRRLHCLMMGDWILETKQFIFLLQILLFSYLSGMFSIIVVALPCRLKCWTHILDMEQSSHILRTKIHSTACPTVALTGNCCL